jgi:phosphoribosylglycinamide formyltransferase 1
MKNWNVGFLASHNGSNMQSVVDACRAGTLSANPVVVISNNKSAFALERARREGIAAYQMNSVTHPDPDQRDESILHALRRHQVDLVVLAGFLKKIGPSTLAAFRNRIVNIHPALLPKYGGKGMFGANVHSAVIAAGDAETGVTIHLVDAEYDHGPVLAQCRMPVEASDTAETLAGRLINLEHEFLVETLRNIISGSIVLPPGA